MEAPALYGLSTVRLSVLGCLGAYETLEGVVFFLPPSGESDTAFTQTGMGRYFSFHCFHFEPPLRSVYSGPPLLVWIWLPGETQPVVAGKLEADNGFIRFNYGKSYLNRRDDKNPAISI